MAATATSIIGGPGRKGPVVYSASANPTVDNDALNGYRVGDIIINTVNSNTYVCTSATTAAAVWLSHPLAATLADPGISGAIPVTGNGHVELVTAGAETRTLAAPSFLGQQLLLSFKTKVGNCVITCATTLNVAANTVLTFSAVRQAVQLVAVATGSNLRWAVVFADGAALS